jgi:beta-1,2-mannobiose phosphorylase / 1,2-beta-oligomannan phosphorylase
MISIQRHSKNPILTPNEDIDWEAAATYNGCIVKAGDNYQMVYRALSAQKRYYNFDLELSTVGCAESHDGISFKNRRLFITPENTWEQFGCEDPRVTKLDDKYYIFYTALADYPPTASGIKIGLAITKDFQEIQEKHQVTDFDSKAMALFPEKIHGKMVVVLTANPETPPSKMALAFFDEESQIWSKDYWADWRSHIDQFSLPLIRKLGDHIEVGSPPLKTEMGWLLLYSHVSNYGTPGVIWGIEAVLLDLDNPLKIIGQTREPLIIPREEYELYGKVNNVIFPSGALLDGDYVCLYYGSADTTVCQARIKLSDLVEEMVFQKVNFIPNVSKIKLERFSGNPIITPIAEHSWEAKYTYNPTAIYEAGKVHILYRAQGPDDTSVIGYAESHDGLHLDSRLNEPVYSPREIFEQKAQPGYSGCEDPRITKMEDRFYVCYTAYDAKNPTRIVMTSISATDFLSKNWRWEKPFTISSPDRDDKNGCLMPEKINGKYAFFHRIGGCIWFDLVNDFDFKENTWVGGEILLSPRRGKWDSQKVGITGAPLKTEDGWLLIYHGLSESDNQYRLGALLLDLENPVQIIAQLDDPILEPQTNYEHEGLRPGTVFSCGEVIIDGRLYVYYGAADEVVAVATCDLKALLSELKRVEI